MVTSTVEPGPAVSATDVSVTDDALVVCLSDGRTVSLPLATEWLSWLAKASAAERGEWALEPGGFAVYWPGLDNGVEVEHLLGVTAVR